MTEHEGKTEETGELKRDIYTMQWKRETEEERDEAYLRYKKERRYVRMQMIPAVVFFVCIALIILVSVVKHRKNVEQGIEPLSSQAILMDYLTGGMGAQIYHQVDEIDGSEYDYFYIGSDYYEVGVGKTYPVFEELGVITYEGDGQVITEFTWISDEAKTETDVQAMAEKLSENFGTYTLEEGVYYWYSDGNGLGSAPTMEVVTCSLDENLSICIHGAAK